MNPIIRLVNRNLTISLNPGFLLWQIIFPLIYIFVAGFAYTSLIDKVPFENIALDYPSFLATGMIGFNIMNSTLVSGIIIWNDRRYGMFEQIMSGPFTRANYILSNVLTIGVIGLVSATLIALVGYPIFFESIEFSIITIPILVFAAMLFCTSVVAQDGSFYKNPRGLFSTRPGETKSLQNIKRFGPVGMGIDFVPFK